MRQDIREQVPDGPFDLVLCRNLVFTYFAPGLQRALLEQIKARLRPSGYLVIGAHETLPEDHHDFVPVSGCREILGPAAGANAGRGHLSE